MKLGKNVARTFLDYYKLNNLIDENKLTGQLSRFVFSILLCLLCFTGCLFQKEIVEPILSRSSRYHQEIVLMP